MLTYRILSNHIIHRIWIKIASHNKLNQTAMKYFPKQDKCSHSYTHMYLSITADSIAFSARMERYSSDRSLFLQSLHCHKLFYTSWQAQLIVYTSDSRWRRGVTEVHFVSDVIRWDVRWVCSCGLRRRVVDYLNRKMATSRHLVFWWSDLAIDLDSNRGVIPWYKSESNQTTACKSWRLPFPITFGQRWELNSDSGINLTTFSALVCLPIGTYLSTADLWI